MPRPIDREGVRRMMAEGAQVVEVLGREEFADEHLPGAINIPIRRIDRQAGGLLDPARPVIVYCWDNA